MRDPLDIAVPPIIKRLKRRSDFLLAGKGRRWHGKALTLQGPGRQDETDAPARVGFTLTKKVGCAVVRNRVRRRLREALRFGRDLPVQPGCDYVVVGRVEALRLPFEALGRELEKGFEAVHDVRAPGSRHRRDDGRTRTQAPGRASPERIRPQS